MEMLGGVLLLLVSPRTITRTVLLFAHAELVGDPHHPIITFVYHIAASLTFQTRQFYSILFLSHGAIKLFLVAGLMKNKLWAYPITILVFTIFVFYQTYEIIVDPSILLGAITIIDLFVIFLIWREYKRVSPGFISPGHEVIDK